MSRDFIGKKITVITKSQCRYDGIILGIDTQKSSILIGNAKCYGTENRRGNSANGHPVGTFLPIVQFANSEIEDLKIMDDEQTKPNPRQQTLPSAMFKSSTPIPDDPAIISAVLSTTHNDSTSNSSASNGLIHRLQNMSLANETAKLLSQPRKPHYENMRFNAPDRRFSNSHSTQTSFRNSYQYHSHSNKFKPNYQRFQASNYQQNFSDNSNLEAFQDNPNDYKNDFDFETSNRQFTKITNQYEPNFPHKAMISDYRNPRF